MKEELFRLLITLPYIHNGEFFDSYKLPQNKTCKTKCKEKDCLTASYVDSLYVCSKGYNNISIFNREFIINGIIFKGNKVIPKGRKDVRKDWIVSEVDIMELINNIKKINLYIEKYSNLKMIENLSMFHDFKSSMNIFYDCTQDIINSLPGDDFEDKLKNSNKAYKDLFNALDLITSQLGMIDVVANPRSISFGTKKEINIYKLFDKIKYIFEHHRITKKKNVSIEIFTYKNRYIQNSYCFDSIEFIPLILLDNALKYSSENSTVTIEFYQNRKKVLVKVKNIGPFVKDENIEKIFNKFFRGEIGEEFSSKGLGVGLWIAKEILSAHNSSIIYSKDRNANGEIGLNIFEFTLDTI